MNEEAKKKLERIQQLGDKSTQLLLFLSFVFVAVITLKVDHATALDQKRYLTYAMRSWALALPPILLGVLPVRDFVKESYYNCIRWAKVFLLWVAIILIFIGVVCLARGVWAIK